MNIDSTSPINVRFAGLGGTGVIKASDIFADVVFRLGHTVKKAEVHGMSQRGGSVQSDIRFGPEVHSPMIPEGACDFLVVLESSQVDVVRGGLRPGGVLLTPADIDLAWTTVMKTPLGPFGMLDYVGIDTAWHITQYWASVTQDPQLLANAAWLKAYVDRGHTGVKTGHGFYDYSANAT